MVYIKDPVLLIHFLSLSLKLLTPVVDINFTIYIYIYKCFVYVEESEVQNASKQPHIIGAQPNGIFWICHWHVQCCNTVNKMC